MVKKIHIGSSDFAEIVTNNGLLADKSLFIKEIIDTADKVLLITRPRRWGKTLSQSMLQCFLSSEVDSVPTKGLFDNLAISKVDDGYYIREHQGKYPVIFISFKDVSELTLAECLNNLSILIQKLFREHRYLINSTKLDEYDRAMFNQYLNGTKDTQHIAQSLYFLCEVMHRHFNQKVYILIDEYDTPLNWAYVNGYIGELTRIMRNLMSSALKDNRSLQKSILTGILRISKDSMLSGLNNLKVYTILERKYNAYFGFTNDELDRLFKEQELDRNESGVKEWYNGYSFGGMTIYNPWSILNCLEEQGKCEAYWVNTSNNTMIEKLLLEFRNDIQPHMLKLMYNEAIEVTLEKYVSFDLLTNTSSSFWGLLLFSGYLTTGNISSTGSGLLYNCTLKIPNVEIRKLFNHFYQQWFYECLRENYDPFLKNLTHGNVAKFDEQLNAYLLESVSVRDTGNTSEKFYHGLVMGLLASLRESHMVLSNYESGEGYADAIVIPLASSNLDLGIVMEFKHDKIGGNLEKLAKAALSQIDDTQYATIFKQYPQVKRVLKLGLAFNKKQVKILPKLS